MLGVTLAWVRRRWVLGDDDAVLGRPTQIAALLGVLAYAPACAYFLAFATDWSMSYAVDGASVPSAVLLVLAALDAVAVPIGFQAGQRAARRGALQAHIALGAVPAVVVIAALGASVQALRVDGTFHQVTAGFGTRPVVGGPLGFAIAWMVAMIAAGTVVAARAMGRPTEASTSAASAAPRDSLVRGRGDGS
jgi:hypothetical protein